MYNAKVTTKSGALNIREWPEEGPVIGKAPKGATVEVLAEAGDGWPKVRYNGVTGYASEAYLARIADGEAAEEVAADTNVGGTEEVNAYTSLTRDDGASIQLVGNWRIAND